ncbi:MAG: hypothetical protein AB2693_32645 [Candidatus Thiodiazotropha sp.]
MEQPGNAQLSTTMAAPSSTSVLAEFDKHLKEFVKQGPILKDLQANMKEMKARMTSLEHKRAASTEEVIPAKKQRAVSVSSSESESENDLGDCLSADQPSGSGDLDKFLSDGELSDQESSGDEMLDDLKSFFADSEETGPDIDTDLSKILNHGLRSLAQADSVKKLKDKHKRPGNVGNLQVPRVAPVMWRNMTEKGKAVDAALQKTVAKFLPGITPVIRQLDLLTKNKKEVKKNPLLQEMKHLASDAVQTLTHAVSSSNQLRKDSVKTELDSKFHSLCEPGHAVSEKQLFGDKLASELKELDDAKKFSLGKRSTNFRDKKYTNYKSRYQEDFRRGYSKNHKPAGYRKSTQSGGQKKDPKKWSQKRQ